MTRPIPPIISRIWWYFAHSAFMPAARPAASSPARKAIPPCGQHGNARRRRNTTHATSHDLSRDRSPRPHLSPQHTLTTHPNQEKRTLEDSQKPAAGWLRTRLCARAMKHDCPPCHTPSSTTSPDDLVLIDALHSIICQVGIEPRNMVELQQIFQCVSISLIGILSLHRWRSAAFCIISLALAGTVSDKNYSTRRGSSRFRWTSSARKRKMWLNLSELKL